MTATQSLQQPASQRVVIAGFGHDRPGIVAGLTGVLLTHGCNLEDTSMTILGGEFAVIMVVSAPVDLNLDVLQSALAPLEQQLGFSASVRPLPPDATPTASQQEGELYLIRVSGHDRTGITYHTSQLLAERQLDITDLQAHRFEGEAGPVYMLLVEFLLKADQASPQAMDALRQALAEMSRQLGVESHLVPVDREVL